MPERGGIIPGMSGVGLVAYMGELSGMPARDAMQRAHEVLHYVGLADERYRKCDDYSQGMKQRLKLAQALVHDPAWIFLDEPTSGLDPQGRVSVLKLIRDLASKKGLVNKREIRVKKTAFIDFLPSCASRLCFCGSCFFIVTSLAAIA